MGLEGRSQQHPSDQAIRAGATCHSRFSASEYQYGENVRHENIFEKFNVAALARQPAHGVSLQRVDGKENFLDTTAGAALERPLLRARSPGEIRIVGDFEGH